MAGDDSTLTILGKPVMESWEEPYMQKLASIAASNGGRVLEVGFGLGISASFVQQHPIEEHMIIEANQEVFNRLQAFAKTAPYPVTPKLGLWEDVVSTLPDGSCDGILYDTYPLSEDDLHIHQFDFVRQAYRLMKPNGVLTYCNLTSWGNLKAQYPEDQILFEKTQVPHLKEAGFSNLRIEIFNVSPLAACQYYQALTILAPIVKK
mgnify:CR=1 FL=1|jgi:guanidinoacetate N-methyltransferase